MTSPDGPERGALDTALRTALQAKSVEHVERLTIALERIGDLLDQIAEDIRADRKNWEER